MLANVKNNNVKHCSKQIYKFKIGKCVCLEGN